MTKSTLGRSMRAHTCRVRTDECFLIDVQTTRMEPTRIQDPKKHADRHTPPKRLRPVVVPRPATHLPLTRTASVGVMVVVVMIVRRRIRRVIVVVVVAVRGDYKHWE